MILSWIMMESLLINNYNEYLLIRLLLQIVSIILDANILSPIKYYHNSRN